MKKSEGAASSKESANALDKNVATFLADNTKIECVQFIVDSLVSASSEQQLIAAIIAVNKVFSRVFSSNEEFFVRQQSNPLKDAFNSAWTNLLAVMLTATGPAELALQTLLKWLEIETVQGSGGGGSDTYAFPYERLEALVSVLCSERFDMARLIDKFVEKMQAFDDLNFFVAKALWRLSGDRFSKTQVGERAIWNYFGVVRAVRVRDRTTDDEILPAFGGLKTFPFSYKELQKAHQYAWLNFLRASLPEKLYVQVLVALDDKRVALFRNPCLLADFLIESYNKGGAAALLALNGLFTLIHKFNLELPDFYTRLYALFRPEVFYTRYRARFFFLADVFLSSTHLPAYLVAAFVKRMARLCLTAPAYSQLHVIPFIGNLIIRHATLGRMVHCEEVKDMSTDPFQDTETDPAKCHALESSLWELKTLNKHWYHRVAAKADIIHHAFPKIEWDFSDVLETGYVQLFDKAVKEKYKGVVPINYHKPKGIFRHADDRMASTWLLE